MPCDDPTADNGPRLEGLEGKQLLSSGGLSVTSAVASPNPSPSSIATPVAIHHTPIPVIRAWATQPYDGVVASFVANTRLSSENLEATIDWGDGQVSKGTVEQSPWGGINVRGDHTYASDIRGTAWIRVDVANAETGKWMVGVEQRVVITQPSITRNALYSAGYQPVVTPPDVANRPQPARLKFVDRRQRYHTASDRYVKGTASAEDIRYLRQVRDFQEQQKKNFFEKVGDEFVNNLPFS